ncbi:MAG: peroxide stress protein YaaA [Mariprofundaceae bacterium]
MLSVLSPAKKLDFETPLPSFVQPTRPRLLDAAAQLAAIMRDKDSFEIADLMGISMKLADLNARRFQDWRREHEPGEARPALFAFAGDVYQGLDATSLDDGALAFAQDHLRILSGLYGLLRPFDLIRAHRLEMGTKLPNPAGPDLYAFWRARITDMLNDDLARQGADVLVNLASNEYFKAVDTARLQARVVTPVFREWRNGRWKVISFNAKRARGMMARYIVENGIDSPDGLKAFEGGGYVFRPEMSEGALLVFAKD